MRGRRSGVLMTMHRMSQGGADRVAILLANGFQAAGIPIDFLLLRSGGEGEHALSGMFDSGVRVHLAGPPMGSRHLELIRGVKAIRALALEVEPSVVLASSSNMGLVTGIACQRLRRGGTAVAMKLTNPVIRPRDRLAVQRVYRRCLYGFIFRQHDRILTLTDAETSALRATYPKISDRFVTVPNPYVSTELLTENPRKRSSIEGGPRLVTLARLMPQKRLDVLLHAFARVKHLDSRLTILGDGPLRAPLEGLALSLGIADRVEMPGFVEDVLPALREADLFVLSSDYEGLPAAMIEALACNVPVVTTDCFFGARSMLGSSAYCAVTPVGDAVELAAAIDRLLVLGPPTGLCELAAVYGMEASIAAHESVMRSLMGMEAA